MTSNSINPGAYLAAMRDATPLVQNITNFVAMNTMANVQLAAGASPAMVHAFEEAPEFVAIAHALTINIGTLSPDWSKSMLATAAAANKHGKPWVFDPVAAGATTYRWEISTRLIAEKPTVTRGNASEIMALTGHDSAGKGADSTDAVTDAMQAATELTGVTDGIVAVSGETDFITDGKRQAVIRNGHSLMPKVTALGCALNGIIGAFVATGDDPFAATVSAMAYYGLAGELAAKGANGPGSFAVNFIDALAIIDDEHLNRHAQIELS